MLNVNLDEETERYLVEILAKEKTTSRELLKHLIRQHWLTFQPRKTILERRGGHPQHLLNGFGDLSDRDTHKKIIAEGVKERHQQQ